MRWLGLYGYRGCTWAKLLTKPGDTEAGSNGILLELVAPILAAARRKDQP
jgi:hypothetical protein